jgi:RES domain-containing protein
VWDPRALLSRDLGDYWIDNELSAVLRVPSAVVPAESNYLLNPRHLDFAQIATGDPVTFEFDERLFLGM